MGRAAECVYSPRMDLRRDSQSELAAGGVGERVDGSDVVVVQGGQVAVSGLRGDPVDRGAAEGGSRGVAGAQRVPADSEVAESRGGSAVADQVADRAGPDALARDLGVAGTRVNSGPGPAGRMSSQA